MADPKQPRTGDYTAGLKIAKRPPAPPRQPDAPYDEVALVRTVGVQTQRRFCNRVDLQTYRDQGWAEVVKEKPAK